MSRILFIIVTYKPRLAEFDAMLKALMPWSLVIVDNSQADDDKAKLREIVSKHQVELISNESNLGFTGGVNVGIRYALKQDIAWIIVLTPDLSLTKEEVGKFCTKLEKLNPGLAGPFGGELDHKRWTTIFSIDSQGNYDYISGAFLAIHRRLLEKIGGLNEPYFMYYEDVDYSIAAKRKGFTIQRIPVKGITHNDSPTLGKNSFLFQYYLARNHLLFVERQAPLKVKLREYLRLPKTLFDHYQKGEKGAIRGIRDYVFRRFGQYKQL